MRAEGWSAFVPGTSSPGTQSPCYKESRLFSWTERTHGNTLEDKASHGEPRWPGPPPAERSWQTWCTSQPASRTTGNGTCYHLTPRTPGVFAMLPGAGERHSTRDKGHEEGGSAYAKAASSLGSPPGYSRASTPKNQSLPTLLLCALTSDLTGGCPPPPSHSLCQRANLQLQLIKFLGN